MRDDTPNTDSVWLLLSFFFQTVTDTSFYEFVIFLGLVNIVSVLYAHYIDSWGYDKFDHPESYGLARESCVTASNPFIIH